MSWTHAICESCFQNRRPDVMPTTHLDAQIEKCCDCGEATDDGITIEADPAKVLYPAPWQHV